MTGATTSECQRGPTRKRPWPELVSPDRAPATAGGWGMTPIGIAGGQTGSKRTANPGRTHRESGGHRTVGHRRSTDSPVAPDGDVPAGPGRHRWRRSPRTVVAVVAVLTLVTGLPPGAVARLRAGATRRLGTVHRHRPDALLPGPPGPHQRRTGGPELRGPADPSALGGSRAGRGGPVLVRAPGLDRHGPGPEHAGCGPAPGPQQICELAGNSGSSGNGLWPGDGSDGMEAAYMSSPATGRTC